MKRKWELLLGMIGDSLSLIFFGGLAVTLSNMFASEFKKSHQSLVVDHPALSLENIFELLQDVTGLSAVALFISLASLAVALLSMVKGKYLTTATGLYFMTGVILLAGIQLIAFPFTLSYFVAGIFSLYRVKIRKEARITQTIKVKNSISRGFSPDPNILRAKDRYYITVPSFEWLPGIRVYESKNLVNWSHTMDILTTQVSLQGNPASGNIWAPQISYVDGLFYLVYTDVRSADRPLKNAYNYLIIASEITGPRSEPIYLNSNGFDPSLFHDLETGKKWLINELWDYRLDVPNKFSGIVSQEYDTEKKKFDSPIYKIFAGTELAETEAPHSYFCNGYYYSMMAEGGTGRGHSVTACRVKNIIGPYELDPGFPMLTASDKPASTSQCTGHGSLVQTPSEKWYMAYLCARPLNGAAILGRETAIQEVYWTSDDWLRLEDSQTAPTEEIVIETNEEAQQEREYQFMDTFEGELKKN